MMFKPEISPAYVDAHAKWAIALNAWIVAKETFRSSQGFVDDVKAFDAAKATFYAATAEFDAAADAESSLY